jgi:hypothetical protein
MATPCHTPTSPHPFSHLHEGRKVGLRELEAVDDEDDGTRVTHERVSVVVGHVELDS